MLALVVILVITNAVTVAALIAVRRRLRAPRRELAPGSRVITIEIHNPIELAAKRGRVFGIAGSFVPDLTRRIVYDQTAKILRAKLVEYHVIADVRIRTMPPPAPAQVVVTAPTPEVGRPDVPMATDLDVDIPLWPV